MKRRKEEKLFYIQHGYVGNAMCWWRKDSAGYSANINEAGKYSELEAKKQVTMRPMEDTAWSCDYIDENEKAHKTIIDAQYCDFSNMIVRKRKSYKLRIKNQLPMNKQT